MRAEWAQLEAQLKRAVPVAEFAMAVDAWSEDWNKEPVQIVDAVRAWREGRDVDARVAQICAEVARRYGGRFAHHPGLAAYRTSGMLRVVESEHLLDSAPKPV